MTTRVQAIDQILPQTQCRRCGFDACLPYAQALDAGTTTLNRCPPGGQAGITQLARLLQRPELPLDPECGVEAPLWVAVIDEAACIGCTKCIQACPVDAIVGAIKLMHTVLPADCTGCELCIAPCPVDCITMQPPPDGWVWDKAAADAARRRYNARQQRLPTEAQRVTETRLAKGEAKLQELAHHEAAWLEKRDGLLASLQSDLSDGTPTAAEPASTAETVSASHAEQMVRIDPALAQESAELARKRAIVEAALARARHRLAQTKPANTHSPAP